MFLTLIEVTLSVT